MMFVRSLTSCLTVALLAGCSKEPPARTVQEFLDKPILLEAAMVRCARDRVETRYEAECVNAREAVKIIEAKEDAARRAELEALSEEKRKALRRTQAAVAEARRRAAEEERLRKEAEYLAQFGELPPEIDADETTVEEGNIPMAILPSPTDDATGAGDDATPGSDDDPTVDDDASLNSVREELQRRNSGDDQ